MRANALLTGTDLARERLAKVNAKRGTQVLDIPVESRDAERRPCRERFAAVRDDSEALAANLTPEDQSIQSMPDVSPTKWHLAHTTWFFETFLLSRLDPGYRAFDPAFAYLFNSYYEAVGPRHPRPRARAAVAPDRRRDRRLSRPRRRRDGRLIDRADASRPGAGWRRWSSSVCITSSSIRS